MTLPPWRGVLLGLAGVGKTTLLAAAPKPLRVVVFDSPYGCTDPYEMYGEMEEGVGTAGQMVRSIKSRKTGKLLIQLDCFWDEEPERPHAFADFFKVRPEIIEEAYSGRWATVGLDTATGMKRAAMNQARYRDNPNTKEPRQWHAATKDAMEPFTCGTMPGLPCNSVLLMHVDEFQVEEQVGRDKVLRDKKVIIAPGTLKREIPAQFAEVYRMYLDYNGDRWLQTRQRGHEGYESCKSSPKINAPDPCAPTWAAIWSNWRKEHEDAEDETGRDGGGQGATGVSG